jgi:Kef-type K+ transport system membrane component KefB
MFMAGLEIDLGEMRRVGRVAVLGGLLGVVVPLILGGLAVLPFGYRGSEAVFIGIILTATSVSISAQTLLELGVLRTREGIALLGAAVVDDVVVILLLSIFLALTQAAGGAASMAVVIAKMVLYIGLASVIGWLLLPRLARWVDNQPISQGLTALAVVSALLFAWAAEVIGGLAPITGAFIAGMCLASSPLRHKLEVKVQTIAYGFFVPIFFVSIGLHTNARGIGSAGLLLLAVLFVIAVLSKIIGAGMGARLGGYTNRESLRVGVGMVSRGEVGLIVATTGVAQGVIPQDVFSVVVILVLLTTLVTPLMLRALFAPAKDAKSIAAA